MKNINSDKIKVVAFDAFDTIVEYKKDVITKGKGAYGLLFQNIDFTYQDAKKRNRYAMSQNISFYDIAELVRQTYDNISVDDIINIHQTLQNELTSMKLYSDTLPAIQELQAKGYKVALISNLAKPYGEKLDTLLPPIDSKGYSYEIGYQKPDKEIFQYIATTMGVQLSEILMIGNHGKHDFTEPKNHGLQSLLLDRCENEISIPNEDKIVSLSELQHILT